MRDVEDEEVMRSFLLGDISPEDRERVEERFFRDRDYFEALCGLEDEMMLSHLRGDLPGRWRTAFDAQILGSPEGRRRVDQTRDLVAVARSSRERPTRQPGAVEPLPWPVRHWFSLAAAASIAVFAGGWLVWGPTGPGPDLQVSRTTAVTTGRIVAFVLAPGATRSEAGPSNLLRVTPEIRTIRLEFNEPVVAATPLRAVLRQVGGDPMTMTTLPDIRRNGSGVDVSWAIPAGSLPRGDYLVTLVSETATQGIETAASRFFSIVE